MKTTKKYYLSYSDLVMSVITDRDEQINEEEKKFVGMLNGINEGWGGTTMVNGEILCTAMNIVEMIHKQMEESENVRETVYKPCIYLLLYKYHSELWMLQRVVEDLFKINNDRTYRVEDAEEIPFAKYMDYWKKRLKNTNVMDDDIKEEMMKIDFTTLEWLMGMEGNDDEKAAEMHYTINACMKFECYCLTDGINDIVGAVWTADFMGDCAKEYCSLHRDEEERRLIRQMNCERFKKDITEEDWCEMRIREERVIRSVVYGGMTSETERTIKEFYDEEIINNVELMEEFNRCLPHGELLYVWMVFKEIDMNQLLRHDNVYMFFRMMLRFNIIQYHIYGEEMKREFEEWMGVAKRDESDKTEEELRESNEVLQAGGKLGSMVSFYALIKEVSGWISKNYEWYAVYRFLRDYSYLKMYNVSKFCGQMTRWFGGGDAKGCKNDDVSRYNKFLENRKFEEWTGISIEVIKGADKISRDGVNNIYQLYKRMKEKYDVR